MKDKYFLDTNIFLYSFDNNSITKRKIANEIINIALKNLNGCISYQVIQEFMNVALYKNKTHLKSIDTKKYLIKVLFELLEVNSSELLFIEALRIFNRWKYSLYDSLIIAAALKANCTILYSEDLQHGQIIDGMKIINPFLEA